MKQLGVISIAFIWAGLLFLIRKWKGNVSMTFSQHAAQYKSSQIYYFGLFVTAIPVFSLFLYNWFIPTFKMPAVFGILAAISMAMMIAAMIVPELEGKKTQIHRAVAFITFICFMPLALLLALSGNISPIARVFAGLVAAYELFGMAYLAPKKGYHQKALWFQISFIGSFHLTIIAATYLR